MKPNERIDKAIDKAAERSDAFMSFIARSWRPIAGGAAALFVLSVAILWMTLYRPFAGKAEPMKAPQETAATSTGFYRKLDGVEVANASSTELLPIGVMVENSADAWPLSGISKANVVFEAPVEGSITRFFLLFDPSAQSGDIGPVRSARPYFVDIANGLHALYAHVGGSPEAIEKMKSFGAFFKNFDEFYNGSFFHRSSSRPSPHNVYTDVKALAGGAEKKQWSAGVFTPWMYGDLAAGTGESAASVRLPYAGVYEASWAFDASTGSYARSQNGKIQKDADGSAVSVKNVIVISSDSTVLDDVGRLRIRTTGSGDAIIARDGVAVRGRWTRKDGENFRFITADGVDIPLARGKTWVSIVTSGIEGVLK